jgi:hypothetical protein
MLIDGIASLTSGHFRVLEVMERPAKGDNPDYAGAPWEPDGIAAEVSDSLSAAGVHATVGGLLARGLIRSARVLAFGHGGGSYWITDFGKSLLAAARRAAAQTSQLICAHSRGWTPRGC